MNTITIDPGARRTGGGTGLAVFDDTEQLRPIKTICFTNDHQDFYTRVSNLTYKIYRWLVRSHYVDSATIYIEEPKFFSSFKGITAATGGSLFKLIYFYGALYNGLFDSFKVKPLQINTWKGNLSKEKVAKRVELLTGCEYTGDVCDAVGMGLHLKGKF